LGLAKDLGPECGSNDALEVKVSGSASYVLAVSSPIHANQYQEDLRPLTVGNNVNVDKLNNLLNEILEVAPEPQPLEATAWDRNNHGEVVLVAQVSQTQLQTPALSCKGEIM
jgi:hypothetical protein